MSLTSAPKRPSHHKKVTGDHHRRSKHYLKAYHPYLPLLLLVIIGLAVNIFWTNHTHVLGATSSMTGSDLLASSNIARETNNQSDLKINNKLSAAAQAKANDMAAKNYWSHTSPVGKTPWSFMTASGYDYFKAGENLAYGFRDSSDTVHGWMNSPEHRTNLLNPDYVDVGFGIATADNYQGHGKATIVVAMYGEPSLGLGASGVASENSDVSVPLRTVSRVQLMTHGNAPWSVALIGLISFTAAAWFALRHLRFWKRVITESEEFVIEHPLLDVAIVSVVVAGFVLTRAAGFIH